MRILDLTRGMAGPLAGMVLADNGADVVKVEQPGGDWNRGTPGFHFWNRGKRSVVIDLRSTDRQKLEALLRWAEVIITDFPPTAARRLRMTDDDIRAVNPDIVHCEVSSFGGLLDGADDESHYEATIAALTGRMSGLDPLSGGLAEPPRSGPTFTLPPVASYAAAMLASLGIIAAVLDRDRTTRRVSTSLLHGAMAFMMREELDRGGDAAVAAGEPDLMYRGIQLCFLTAECADGRYIQMCARQDHHFRSWLEALDLSPLLDDPRFERAPLDIRSAADLDELEGLLRERMRTRTQAEWMELFTTVYDIGADPFLTTDEFLDHPQVVENGRIVDVDDPQLGVTRQLGPLVLLDRTPACVERPAPILDEGRDLDLDCDAVSMDAKASSVLTSTDRPGPLAGVTVLEIAYFVAGPLATTLLAELGARIVKIEPIDGDPYRRTGRQSAKFLHGKESIALDLKSDAGRQILHELIVEADVLVHGFRAGVPDRLGMDEATARSLNPDIVYLNAASYGSKGPQAARIAFHSTPTALTGAGILQAGAGNPPVDDSFPDPAAGVAAAVAIALGLLARDRLGVGQYLETTMLCSTGYVMSGDLVRVAGSTRPRLADRGQHGLCATYRLYECADGWIFLAAVRAAEWAGLASLVPGLGDDRFATADLRATSDNDLVALLIPYFQQRAASAAQAALRAAGVPATVVTTDRFEEWLVGTGILTPASHPDFGDYWQLPHKVTVNGRTGVLRPACSLGEHSDAILGALRRGPDEIARLRDAGVVA